MKFSLIILAAVILIVSSRPADDASGGSANTTLVDQPVLESPEIGVAPSAGVNSTADLSSGSPGAPGTGAESAPAQPAQDNALPASNSTASNSTALNSTNTSQNQEWIEVYEIEVTPIYGWFHRVIGYIVGPIHFIV